MSIWACVQVGLGSRFKVQGSGLPCGLGCPISAPHSSALLRTPWPCHLTYVPVLACVRVCLYKCVSPRCSLAASSFPPLALALEDDDEALVADAPDFANETNIEAWVLSDASSDATVSIDAKSTSSAAPSLPGALCMPAAGPMARWERLGGHGASSAPCFEAPFVSGAAGGCTHTQPLGRRGVTRSEA